MNKDASIKTVGLGASVATVILWLIGFYQPELMGSAPVGLEAAIGGIITVLLTYILPSGGKNA